MSDLFSAALEIQRKLLDAQKAQIDAATRLMGAGKQIVDLQEAAQKAAEANYATYRQWAKLWGWR